MKDTRTDQASPLKDKIIARFLEYYLEHGVHPKSVFKFAKELKISESDFYQFFGSFRAVEKAIWSNFMVATIEAIKSEKAYTSFNMREKLLSFYYTHLEFLKKQRSFVLLSFEHLVQPISEPAFLKEYKHSFFDFCRDLIDQGLESEEIATRKYITDHYEQGFWIQLLFILKFWVNDDSPDFEKTDAAVEKAVHLSFDLIAKGPIESMVDFAKFVYQNR